MWIKKFQMRFFTKYYFSKWNLVYHLPDHSLMGFLLIFDLAIYKILTALLSVPDAIINSTNTVGTRVSKKTIQMLI